MIKEPVDDNDRPLWWKVISRKYVVTDGTRTEYYRFCKPALRRAAELGGGYVVRWRFGEKAVVTR